MVERIGVYPGTFDPITNGHLDIITRAATMFDHLVIGVAVNAGKGPLFSLDERVELTRQTLQEHRAALADTRVTVVPFEGLLVEFARQQGAQVVVRGLRAVSDFEYEFQMAGMNARLDAQIETVFLMASEGCQFISSRFVKEIGRLGGAIGQFVPGGVKAALAEQFARQQG